MWNGCLEKLASTLAQEVCPIFILPTNFQHNEIWNQEASILKCVWEGMKRKMHVKGMDGVPRTKVCLG